jgi:hypothetical protein
MYGNQGFVIAHVTWIDKIRPVITLLGNATVTIPQGSSYADAGATAEDNYDGIITDKIIINNPVNISLVGTYTVTYNVTDAAGNAADQVARTVIVENSCQDAVCGQSDGRYKTGVVYTVNTGACDVEYRQPVEYRAYTCGGGTSCVAAVIKHGYVVTQYVDNDQDNDEICNNVDKCANTVLPDNVATA